MLQIYYDFSGYSDMAIGLGRMLGFTFRENFNYPFTSFSVSEFWRRWHISLSSWFKEYIYIPLGGNRKGKGRTYFNLFIVFLLTGIWHGANFTYLLWGIYYAVLQIIEKLFLGKLLDKNPIKAINVIYNLLTATVGFTIFRAANIFDAGKYLSALFSFSPSGLAAIEPLSMQAILALVFGILLCGIVQRPLRPAYEKIKTKLPVLCIDYTIQFTILIITILMLISGTYNPFIYFQF
jgi:alginate O-acetyltransferase complex protein AlgI